jgi:hypothetical protein
VPDSATESVKILKNSINFGVKFQFIIVVQLIRGVPFGFLFIIHLVLLVCEVLELKVKLGKCLGCTALTNPFVLVVVKKGICQRVVGDTEEFLLLICQTISHF